MYEYYPKEKLIEMYPILETKADILINFVSCDGVMAYKLASVIGDLNPDVKYKFQNACVEGKMGKGKIIIIKKVVPFTDHFPALVHLPVKESFKDKPSYDFIREGFEKLEFAYKSNKIQVNKIAVQKGIVPDELLEKALSGLELPEILLYEEVDYYGKLEKIKEEREAAEKAEFLKKKEEERIKKEEEKLRIKAEKLAEKESKKKK